MFKKIQIVNKYLLIAGSFLLLIMGYELAFKNTAVAWQTNKELKNKLASSTELSYQPEYLERKSNNLDKLIALYQADTSSLRNILINQVSLLADQENVKLSQVPVQDTTFNSTRAIVEKFEFEGDFFSLVRLSDKFHKEQHIGVIRSAEWKTINIRKDATERKSLLFDVFLEILK